MSSHLKPISQFFSVFVVHYLYCSNDQGIDNLSRTTIRMSSHLRPISQLFSVFVVLYLYWSEYTGSTQERGWDGRGGGGGGGLLDLESN